MKISLQLFAFLLFPFFLFGQNYFEPLGGPVGVSVKSSFKDANGVLYVKTINADKHMKSYDDGETWLPVLVHDSIQVHELYGDNQAILYAIGSDTIAYRSDQNGINWTVVDLPNTPSNFNKLNVSPSGNLFFTSFPELFFSENKGVSWELISTDAQIFYNYDDIEFHPNGDLYAFFFTSENYLAKSTDGGYNWEKIFVPPTPNFFFPQLTAVHISSGGFIYVKEQFGDIGIFSNFYLSNNNGLIFNNLLSDKPYNAFLTTNVSEDIFYTDLDKIFMSKDNGQNWINISSGLPTFPIINHIYIDDDQYIYLSLNDNVLYKSIVPSTQITAIEEPMDEPFFSLDISPNPTSDFINFQFSTVSTIGKAVFRVVDVHGRVVEEMESDMPKETHSLSVQDWAAGVYFLQYVEDGLIRHAEKFVVN